MGSIIIPESGTSSISTPTSGGVIFANADNNGNLSVLDSNGTIIDLTSSGGGGGGDFLPLVGGTMSGDIIMSSDQKIDYTSAINITDTRGNTISSSPSPAPNILGLSTALGQAMYLVDGFKAGLEYDADNKLEADVDGIRLHSANSSFKFYKSTKALHVALNPANITVNQRKPGVMTQALGIVFLVGHSQECIL